MAEERHLYTVLSNLKSNREETKGALQATTVSLIHDHNKGRITDILQSGLLHSLVGLIRCTTDADILYIALQLLSVLTHGSDEMRLELARMKIVSVLLPLLTPPQEKSEWEWIPVQEMVLTALRKVTFHCEANQAAFITMGGSSLVVKLCKYDQNKYPPETTERLRELVVDKLLIAAVLPVNKDEKKITSSIFPVLSHFEAIDYPLYYVDIANEDKTWITDILVKEGLGIAASPNRSFLDSENLSWIVARGTHVSGSNSLWLNFSVDRKPDSVKEMVDSLLKLPHPSSIESPPIPLPLSFGVYAVWSEGVWYRGWLLNDDSKEKRSDHTFLCLDYGFEVSVPLNHVMVLPDSCRGIAPQAAPCILLGMDSPPKSYTILRHTAAILGNIAFEKELYRREIKVTGGVTLLLELLDCPDDKVKEASLGAVINLTHSKEVCVLMRQLGAIQILTELCTLPNISIQISGLCLGILTNALINDTEEALEVFEVYHVYDRLMNWHEERKEHCTDIEGIIEQVLTTISGLRSGNKIVTDDEKPGLTCAPFPKQGDTTPKTSKMKTTSSFLSPSPHHRHNGAGSKHKTSPTYRLLSSELRKSMSAPASQEAAIIPPPVTAPGSGSTSDVLLFGSIMNRYNKNNSCNLFIDICSIESLKRHNIDDRVLRSLCALANDETGGCVYLGVASSGIVHGIPLERAQKDMIRRDIDQSISRVIVPSLDDRYIVSFLPVLRGGEREGEGVTNSFVIEINVLASLTNAVHILRGKESKDGGTTDERCFVTRDGQPMKLSLLEVQELVEAREIERYKKKENIQTL